MPPALNRLKEQVLKLIASLSPRARAATLGAIVLLGGLFVYLFAIDHTEYSTLFSGLATDDAARIAEQLRKQRVPYRLEAGGAAILVPSGQVHETRLVLAGQGLPRGGGVGFEIFDAQKLGISEFAQQVNYRRALQGELERTISQLDGVQSARVHIALPERQIFARRGQQVSASVSLRMHSGRTVSREAVQAIVHLVSSSEVGLTPEQITVVDASGVLLWSGRQQGGGGSGGPLDQKRTLEESLERRLTELLDTAVGPGHAVVRVTAEVALAALEQTDTEFDPDKLAIRSESTLEEKDARPGTQAAGIPGVQGNLPGGPAPATGSSDGASQRKSAVRNYEVNKTVRKRVSPAGELRRLSVAVLLDSVVLAAAKGRPRPPTLVALEQVVRQAVGFSAARGDAVTLQAVPFPEHTEERPGKYLIATRFMEEHAGGLKLALGTILALIVLMALRRSARGPQREADLLQLPRTVRDLESTPRLPAPAAASRALPETEQPALMAHAAAQSDAARTASVLKAWMTRE